MRLKFPNPWFIDATKQKDLFVIREVYTNKIICKVKASKHAKLIASAPDLIDQLQMCAKRLSDESRGHEIKIHGLDKSIDRALN